MTDGKSKKDGEILSLDPIRQIAKGAYSKVFEAKDNNGGVHAVKIHKVYEDGILANEITIAHSIISSYIIHAKWFRFYDKGYPVSQRTKKKKSNIVPDKREYIIAYPKGEDLNLDLRMKWEYKDYSLQDRFLHAYQVAMGLADMHDIGFAHLDVKPANVILVDGRARIIDFGLSVLQGRRSAIFTHLKRASEGEKGVLGYRPPENIYDNIYGTFTDVWSWGIFFVQLMLRDCVPDIQEFRHDSVKIGEYVTKTIDSTFDKESSRYRESILTVVRYTLVDRKIRASMHDIINLPFFSSLRTKHALAIDPFTPTQNQLSDEVCVMLRDDVRYLLQRSCRFINEFNPGREVKLKEPVREDNKMYARLIKQAQNRLHIDTFFLAVDIMYRSYHISPAHMMGRADVNRFHFLTACLFLAIKVCAEPVYDDTHRDYDDKYTYIYEKTIIDVLKGVIYRPHILSTCNNKEDIIAAYKGLLLRPREYVQFVCRSKGIVDTLFIDIHCLCESQDNNECKGI